MMKIIPYPRCQNFGRLQLQLYIHSDYIEAINLLLNMPHLPNDVTLKRQETSLAINTSECCSTNGMDVSSFSAILWPIFVNSLKKSSQHVFSPFGS